MNIQTDSILKFNLQGVAINAPSALVTPAIAKALSTGVYEAEEARIAAKALRPGDRVLEIGSGLGFISTLIARDSRVDALYAVEADPRLAHCAADTLRLNGVGCAEVKNALFCAAPTQAAPITFYQRPDFWMSSTIETDAPYDSVIKVPVLPLDETIKARGVTCLVCDIEGAEVELLGAATLDGVDRVIVELHDHVTGLSGVAALFDAMRAKGFVYDPRCAEGSVVLFRRLGACADRRPYGEL